MRRVSNESFSSFGKHGMYVGIYSHAPLSFNLDANIEVYMTFYQYFFLYLWKYSTSVPNQDKNIK